MTTLRLSVVIPAFDEEMRLPGTLHRVLEYLAERGEPFESHRGRRRLARRNGARGGAHPAAARPAWSRAPLPAKPWQGGQYPARYYFIAALPALLVLLAAGAPQVAGEWARVAATAVLGAAMVLAVTMHLVDPAHGREDIRAAGDWLDAHVPADQEIVVTSSEMAYLATFHWPGRRFRLYPAYATVAGASNADGLAAGVPFEDGDRAIYLIGRAWTSDPSGALQAALSRRFRGCGGAAVRGIEIRCLSRSDARHASQ